MSNPIIMLAGLPGTGKSKLGLKLEERLGYDRHTVTDIRRELGHKRWLPKQNPLVFDILYERAEQSVQQGRGIIVENAHTTPRTRGKVYGISSNYSVDVLVVECYCSEAEAGRRIRLRPKSDGLVSDPRNTRAYDRLAAIWQDIGEDLKLFPFVPLSYVRYNTETNEVQEVQINLNVRPLVDKIKEIIKS